ncbi:hypothetical protein TRFO_10391 [Tritrichomonas foetus]|uniref:Prenyltransferase alpha-alpha toroid domain-containing protein n=1 Tax=Tritrichomonas foetus TaxID=1144522 RepID=A0A1J4JBW1_9EUKA|nr:hypothetical protein TRFO_10391 [Tritrichomonas foetus]|eukprot:OHS95735.1 hypothetical protein TRFO_10391 [Tritrichomonas foetus]
MGKEVSELTRFQHQSGGFYDNVREANARDTFHAIWISSIYGAFQYIDTQRCFRWFTTLRNRDGGAGLVPGSKSSVFATYCHFNLAAIISPDAIDVARIIEFLKSCYDEPSGLFRDSPESEPSIEATYYAYELLSRFRNAEITWLTSYNLQMYINDHLNDDHFEFDGVSLMKAQLWAGSIAKFVSLTVPYHRISEFIVNHLNQAIKDNKLDNEDAAAAARILKLFGDEAIPEQLSASFKSSGSLADLFYINQILVATGEVTKFFEVHVHSLSGDNHLIDFEKDGLTYGQIARPALAITALGRFINTMLQVNVTTHIGDEAPTTETLKIDYQTGLFNSQRISSINKLGQMQIDVVAWLATEFGTPVVITKSVVSRVSLPIDVTSEAWLSADEPIPVGGEIVPGVNFRVQLNGKLDDIIDKLEDTTAATFQVTDPAGAVLYHKFEDFKGQLEFTWQLPSLALPAGDLHVTVEIGDKVNGIHTHKEFTYKVSSTMAASGVEVPANLRLSDVLRVKMVPALIVNEAPVPFTNEKFFEGDLRDATGEAFYPQTASEAQRYTMRVKVGDVVVKTVEGEVSVDDQNKLSVEFESNVNENLDFATGFSIDFLFNAEGSEPVLLDLEKEIFVQVSSKVVVEAQPLVSGAVDYGSKITSEFRLKDEDSGNYLEAGRAYPVIAILRASDRTVLLEKKAKILSDKYKAKLTVTAAVESGNVIVAILIRKGDDLVPVQTAQGSPFESAVTVSGQIQFDAQVVEARKYVVVDFTTTYKGKALRGTAFMCRVVDAQGNAVAELPLAQMKKGSRLSWESGDAKGEYKLELRRLSATEGAPIFVKSISVESPILSIIHHLPVEGITLAVAFAIFVWSIRVRKQIQSTR